MCFTIDLLRRSGTRNETRLGIGAWGTSVARPTRRSSLASNSRVKRSYSSRDSRRFCHRALPRSTTTRLDRMSQPVVPPSPPPTAPMTSHHVLVNRHCSNPHETPRLYSASSDVSHTVIPSISAIYSCKRTVTSALCVPCCNDRRYTAAHTRRLFLHIPNLCTFLIFADYLLQYFSRQLSYAFLVFVRVFIVPCSCGILFI